MKKNRIQKITLNGFRGVKETLEIDLKNSCSLLVYGDNGTGKSTITDSIEWFLYDRISHLTGEEIPRKEGIRNIELNEKDICHVDINFSSSLLHSQKTLELKSDRLISKHSNKEENFLSYLKETSKENLILRSDDLIKFIILSKSQRLADISDLIGYSEVKKVKYLFKKTVGGLKRSFKANSFENQITSKQSDLLGLFQENIHNEDQFFSKINSLSKELKIDSKVDSWETLEKLEIELSKVKPDPKLQLKLKITQVLSDIKAKEFILNQLFKNLDSFQKSYTKLFEDKEKLKGINLKSLLKSAEHIIKSKFLTKDECPLCLQGIPLEELLHSIQQRLEKLQTLEKETGTIIQIKKNITESIKEIGPLIKIIQELNCMKDTNFENIKKQLNAYLNNLRDSHSIFASDLRFISKTHYDNCISQIKSISLEQTTNQLEKTKESIKESPDSKIDLTKKITLAKSLFKDIQNLSKKRQSYELQIKTMDEIYKSFANYQKEEMELFLSSISDDMNYFFNYMNPSDNIKDIELKSLSNDDGDFIGVYYKLNFRNTVLKSPKMLLSESYLNCLGLCLFLSSVKSFNKKNDFFILDDIISSFDKNHRQLFGRLITEKFSDWQIIVLTHEDEWFKYLSSVVKQQENWLIKKMKWNEQNGSFIDIGPASLKEKIEQQIQDSNPDGLGNLMGRYLESILKIICQNLGASLKAKFDDNNEKRGLEELLSSLIARIKKKNMGLEDHEAIKNLKNIQFFRNQTSHDNSFSENLADMKVCFQDIIKFENLFICSQTEEPLLASKASNNKIQTNSGHLSYNWK